MIPSKLKQLREKHEFKQEYVAKKIYRCRSAYSHYERGHINPSMEVLTRILALYGLTVDEFIQMELKEIMEAKIKELGLLPAKSFSEAFKQVIELGKNKKAI
jgi:transcriptional regulator with XRE-family HTH domain